MRRAIAALIRLPNSTAATSQRKGWRRTSMSSSSEKSTPFAANQACRPPLSPAAGTPTFRAQATAFGFDVGRFTTEVVKQQRCQGAMG